MPDINVQAIGLVCFSSSRQFLFSFFFAAVGSTFGYENFGFLTGLANAVSVRSIARSLRRLRCILGDPDERIDVCLGNFAAHRHPGEARESAFCSTNSTASQCLDPLTYLRSVQAGVLMLNAPLYEITASHFDILYIVFMVFTMLFFAYAVLLKRRFMKLRQVCDEASWDISHHESSQAPATSKQ